MQKQKQSTRNVMDRIATMKMNLFIRIFLFLVLSVFLLSNASTAQVTSIQVGSMTRQMIIYATPTGEQNRPLVIAMHGRGDDMYGINRYTQFPAVARDNNFHLVAPQGINNSWQLSGNTDIDFILAIIEEMSRRYNIDRSRVYLSGFSMGGMMTYYAATRIADKIAAFAPIAGYLLGGPNTNSSRPIPIIHLHGDSDNTISHSGVQQHMNAWISRNGCPTTPVVTKPYPTHIPTSQSTKRYWGPGTNGVAVVFITLAGVGHNWSDNPNGVHTSWEIWNFCKNYSLNNVPNPVSYTMFKNRATGLQIDGMYRTTNGANAGQYATSGSAGQQWMIETVGSYVKLKNRATGLYLDGMGRTTNGSACGQYSGGTSYNQQWTIETVGSYVKLRNRGTGLYVDGMGRTTNGADLGQYASGGSYNQQWTMSTVSGRLRQEGIDQEEDNENLITVSPNPFVSELKVTVEEPKEVNKILMMDLTGKQVEVIEHEHVKREQLMGHGLKSGVYVLQINEIRNRRVFKVIKK